MSRLTAYQQKEFKRRIVLIIITLIVLVILIATVGFNLLVKTSVFIDSLGGGSEKTSDEEAFFGNLDVDTPAEATNSAKIAVSGSVTGYDMVDIEINNKRVKSLKNKTSFDEVVGDLQKGQNTLEVIARLENSKKTSKRESFQILYKSDKPKLDLREPTDGTKTSNTEVKVSGTTDPGVSIQVNGAPIVVDLQGSFQTSVRLTDGDNKIRVVAVDTAGNTETKEITVRYEKD